MGSLRGWSCLLLGALGVTACSSWTGPQEGGGGPATNTGNVSEGDSGVPDIDGGKRPVPDASDTSDGSVDTSDGSVEESDAGLDDEKTVGDDRAGFEHCGATSCDSESVCCAPPGAQGGSWCKAECGTTESTIGCDGPEDCSSDQLCCHTVTTDGVRGECVDSEAPASDAGPAARQCEGPELHVACHTDDDCAATNAPLCRANSGRTLGYCRAETDDLATPGHDELGFVGCGGDVEPADAGAGVSCDLESQICCLSRARPDVAACGEIADCGESEVRVHCDGPEDCEGGAICCQRPAHELHGIVFPPSIECSERCDAPFATTRCHTQDDCSEGSTCQPDPTTPWWGRCVPN